MNHQQEYPLVSVALMTYNQEVYVKESLLSVLNQTYDNLEIIISDDCSKDRTWEVIEHEVDVYRGSGGKHNNIVLNRNQTNLGVAKHFELILSKCHGELIVCQAGDDISHLERIQVIVNTLKNHPGATVLSHEAICIDDKGQNVGTNVMKTSALMPLGAMMSYSRRVYDEFDPISEDGAWEDDVYARRAQMLGEEVQIKKVLLKYRIGCGGICSGKDDIKVRRTRVALGCLAAARQSRRDLERCKNSISADKLSKVSSDIDWYEKRYTDEYNLYNAKSWFLKVRAFHGLYKGSNSLSYVYHFIEKLLPNWMYIAVGPVAKLSKRAFRRCEKE